MKLSHVVMPYLALLVFSLTAQVYAQEPGQLPGDLDGDGNVTLEDIDGLCSAITDREFDIVTDINGDGRIGYGDLETVLETVGIPRGDVNLDGKVQFRDFIRHTSNFGLKPATWSDGDFACDGEVNFVDFLILSSNYGEFKTEAQVADAIAAVPEPSSAILAAIASIWLVQTKRRHVGKVKVTS